MADPKSISHLPSSSDAAIMTNTHVPHLPNEILSEIASYVSDDDIPNLRLAASIFHVVTADRFAVTFFQDRAYDISSKGLKALLKITEHPSFARHIRTIVICHGGRFTPTRHNNYLEQAFQNLASIGNTISLGMRQVRKCRNYRLQGNMILDDTLDFFQEFVLDAAVYAQLPLGDLVADVQSASQKRMFSSVTDNWVAPFTRTFFRDHMSLGRFDSLKIKFSSTQSDSRSPGYALINNRDKRLEVSHTGTSDWFRLLPYGYHTSCRQIVLEDCCVTGDCLLWILERSRHVLHDLSLCDVRLKKPIHGRCGTWQSVFASPWIPSSVLRSCKLGNLQDEANGCWLEGGDKTIEASSRDQVSAVLSNLAVGKRTFTLNAPDEDPAM